MSSSTSTHRPMAFGVVVEVRGPPMLLYEGQLQRAPIVCFPPFDPGQRTMTCHLRSAWTGAKLEFFERLLDAHDHAAKVRLRQQESGALEIEDSGKFIILPATSFNNAVMKLHETLQSTVSACDDFLRAAIDVDDTGDFVQFKQLPTPSQVAEVYTRLLSSQRAREIAQDEAQRKQLSELVFALYMEATDLVNKQIEQVAGVCEAQHDAPLVRQHVQQTFHTWADHVVKEVTLPSLGKLAKAVSRRKLLATFIACRLCDPPIELDEQHQEVADITADQYLVPPQSSTREGVAKFVLPGLASRKEGEAEPVEWIKPKYVWVETSGSHALVPIQNTDRNAV
ncbi:hypothetical protein PTSG_10887 [Salpingoeca rosetta]|uniref:Uncharacterized protein n=1 Tax=Salpingoeca rosetta (strain ATCC 50818 / BSB-021) TaxID=946362 RepID=F2URA5_SALR5|nr:uncharacterized protein PTSG_10887 [Salpingoeca rosetta]EGD80208.1 hypothetical protein PTSG_10887 [Salpingoeca rosetta]|eukprot:XP_004988270.1 hypothetical protein PTSG_10887 [Salpingoeca rosetta]